MNYVVKKRMAIHPDFAYRTTHFKLHEYKFKDYFRSVVEVILSIGASCYVCYLDSRPVARIGIRKKGRKLVFGCWETINDPVPTRLMIEKALGAFASVESIQGPFSYDQEAPYPGLLEQGDGKLPIIFAADQPSYYYEILKTLGLNVVQRLNFYHTVNTPEFMNLRLNPDIKVRHARFSWKEAQGLKNLFNEALKGNWGFVPFENIQIFGMLLFFKLFFDLRIILIIDDENGKPIACAITIPNISQHFQYGFFKGLWRTLTKKPIDSTRPYGFAVHPDHQGKKLAEEIFRHTSQRFLAYGYKTGEIGWVLDDNEKMKNFAITRMQGKLSRQYAVFEAPIKEGQLPLEIPVVELI